MPGRKINVKPIQTHKEGVFSLEVSSNETPPRQWRTSEIKLALPPVKGSAFPDIPSLICHFNVSIERWVLIVGEDILEQGLEVTCLVINCYLLVGQSKVWLPFEMAAHLIFCQAIERKCLGVHV